MDRTRGKNATRKNWQGSIWEYPRRIKTRWKAKKETAGRCRKLSEENGRGWRKVCRDRNAWKLILREARVSQLPYSQWRSEMNHPLSCTTCNAIK